MSNYCNYNQYVKDEDLLKGTFSYQIMKGDRNLFLFTNHKKSRIVLQNKGHGEPEMIIQSAVFTKLKTINSNIIKHQHKFKESSLVE